MLEILAVQTKEEQKRLCEICNIEFRLTALSYAAYVDDELVGVSQFGIKGKDGYIFDLVSAPEKDDEDALFIMGRGLLNFLDLSGIHDAYIAPSATMPRKLSARIGFFPDDEGRLYMNLRGFFTDHHH